MMSDPRFLELVRQGEAMDLAEAALLVARMQYPDLDITFYLDLLDAMAERSVCSGWSLERLHRLRKLLFEEEGFRGNAEDYHDPRNSFLNDVLDRKLGVPITLSLVFMEVGKRIGLAIAGIGLPGHFVVECRAGGERLLIDPFNQGRVLSADDCEEVVSGVLGRPVKLEVKHFAPLTKQQILTRMLNNLKGIYFSREEWSRALEVVERLGVLIPGDPVICRDRGIALAHIGRFDLAISEWEEYLKRAPDAADAKSVREHLGKLRLIQASWN